jgi:pyruvate/2-oxoacid:ferredoxin oxidoreductase beta subunit
MSAQLRGAIDIAPVLHGLAEQVEAASREIAGGLPADSYNVWRLSDGSVQVEATWRDQPLRALQAVLEVIGDGWTYDLGGQLLSLVPRGEDTTLYFSFGPALQDPSLSALLEALCVEAGGVPE